MASKTNGSPNKSPSKASPMRQSLGTPNRPAGDRMQTSATSSAGGEIVYGGSTASSDESRVMSEKVQQLAQAIYQELESVIRRYDENAVKDLMPLVVNVLETLDIAYLDKEEHEVEMELLKEENEQLTTQYEREKMNRRNLEQKLLDVEDHTDQEQRQQDEKIESLESIVRMLELKAKNASDHATRMDEREAELKTEYEKLHTRYTDLFKTHIDYMERSKYLLGNEKYDAMQSSVTETDPDVRKRMIMSIDGAAAMKAMSDAHTSQLTTSTGPRVDESLSSELGEWNEEPAVESAAEILATPRDTTETTPRQPHSRANSELVGDNSAPPSGAEDSLAADFTAWLTAEDGDAPHTAAAIARIRQSGSLDTQSMGREIENLIKENTELLETKNALNIVKNDLINRVDELSSEQDILREEIRSLELVRAKMGEKIKEQEEEMKELRDKIHEWEKERDDEDNLPPTQKKRFTRVEMARVLMERNQYKEKLMELQEAVKYSEMVRATKALRDPNKKEKQGLWAFFASLLGGAEIGTPASAHYQRGHDSDPLKRRANRPNKKTIDFLDPDYSSEHRSAERRKQYKLVKAHVMRDESGRTQAYGWSIPTQDTKANMTVPVPVLIRPIMHQDNNLKLWCASSVQLFGGRTESGYIRPAPSTNDATSSLMWIVSSSHHRSRAVVADCSSNVSVLAYFDVAQSHVLCVTGVPGVTESDVNDDKDDLTRAAIDAEAAATLNAGEELAGVAGQITKIALKAAADNITFINASSNETEVDTNSLNVVTEIAAADKQSTTASGKKISVGKVEAAEDALKVSVEAMIIPERQEKRAETPKHIEDIQKLYGSDASTSAQPTVWCGAQNGFIYIHSAVTGWEKCVQRYKCDDAVLSIAAYKGRVFASLANGTVAIFRRDSKGLWATDSYHVLTIGKRQSGVRCLCIVGDKLWCAYRNTVHIVNATSLELTAVITIHPKKDSEVRQLTSIGDGVWCSIRRDSALRLFHATTHAHLQDVDIEPHCRQLLGTSKLGFAFVRTTALLIAANRLWIGTGTGVILSVPFSVCNSEKVKTQEDEKQDTSNKESAIKGPGGLVKVYSDGGKMEPGTFIPYVNMTHAQLSFHGHKDTVRFFISVRGDDTVDTGTVPSKLVVLSGGDGYIDFRVGEDDEAPASAKEPKDLSHLIVWNIDSSDITRIDATMNDKN